MKDTNVEFHIHVTLNTIIIAFEMVDGYGLIFLTTFGYELCGCFEFSHHTTALKKGHVSMFVTGTIQGKLTHFVFRCKQFI